MLDVFYQYLNTHTSQTFLHWNMRDQNYGFQAIEHRHRVLGGAPLVVPNDRKIDLSRLLIELYGVAYIGHPRLETLLTLNNITSQDFMTGKAEAEAFVEGKYVDLHRSTLRKVDIFCNLAVRTFDGKLKTNSSWKEIYGISWRALSHLVKNNPFYTTATVIAGLATASVSLFKATEYFRGP